MLDINEIAKKRRALKVTQKKLGDVIGRNLGLRKAIHPNTIKNWEAGKTEIPLAKAKVAWEYLCELEKIQKEQSK